MINDIIIMAAGASSRMKSSVSNGVEKHIEAQANTLTKGLIEVGKEGKPLLYYLLKNIKESGYKTVYFVTGEEASLFKKTIRAFQNLERLEFKFATQFIPKTREKPLGTADAIWQTLHQFPELKATNFTVCNSDNLYSVNAFLKLRTFDKTQGLIAFDLNYLKFPKDKITGFALLVFNADFKLVSILEKPTLSQFETLEKTHGTVYVSMNCFTFNGVSFYPFLENCPIHPDRNEKELPTAISNMLESSTSEMFGVPLQEHVPDLTTKEDLLIIGDFLNY